MYAVPAAHGPMSAAICGITPLATTSSRNRCPEPANSEPTASWIRAPALSSSHTNGIRFVSRELAQARDLAPPRRPHRARHDREVVRADREHPPVDLPVAGDDPVGRRHAALEPADGVIDPGVQPELGERARLDEQGDPLARGQLAGGVLLVDLLLPAAAPAAARRAARSSASGRRMGGAPPVAGPVSVAMVESSGSE